MILDRRARFDHVIPTPRREAGITIAVGTRVTPRPPHRSRRALLTHRAPALGV